MKDLEQFIVGGDATKAPRIQDWKAFYFDVAVPAYHYQPLLARKIPNILVRPVRFDGRRSAEVGTYEDVEDPAYAMQPIEKDDDVLGDTVDVKLPQISKTIQLSDDEMAIPIHQQDRLGTFTTRTMEKIGEFEDIKAFQGDAKLKIEGFVGADSYDLENPTANWGIDAGSDGRLQNAKLDIMKVRNRFMNLGMGKRPLHVRMTNYAYTLLESTEILYAHKTNLEWWLQLLPQGSTIDYSNNIQAGVLSTANTMVVFAELAPKEKGAYMLLSSGIEQKVHQTGVWSRRVGYREKFASKVVNNRYVCWMDGINVATS